uniref:Deacetylase sirtuin-type domain-containing protein n=1 Tax=Marmota marmota marmota TaxID=9994 RepID=A0A8C5Z039_MARMA
MAAGGLSRSERKAVERVRRLREEQQRERLPPGVAHPEEGGDRAQRRGGPAAGRQRGPCHRAAGPESAARGSQAAAGGGESSVAGGGRRAAVEAAGGVTSPGSRQVCDDPEELRRKVQELAGAVRNAKYLVVYTGAGISTVGTEAGRAGVGAPVWATDPEQCSVELGHHPVAKTNFTFKAAVRSLHFSIHETT